MKSAAGRHTATIRALALASLSVAAGCGESDDAPVPPAPGVVLDVDGLWITADEIAAFDAYFDELDRTMGRMYRTRELLDRFLLPLAIARRGFPVERDTQRRRAEELASVAQTHAELSQRGAIVGGFEREDGFARNELPLPVAAWAFAPEHILQASPPIETPEGFVLIAARDILPGITSVGDRAIAFLVPFQAVPTEEFERWLGEQKRALRGRVRYVTPELEDCLPSWLLP